MYYIWYTRTYVTYSECAATFIITQFVGDDGNTDKMPDMQFSIRALKIYSLEYFA